MPLVFTEPPLSDVVPPALVVRLTSAVVPPTAPAWIDIAKRYRDDPGASERLTRAVMTGSNPQARHWAGKVSEANMPPNAGVVTQREARALVNWILVLVP